MSTISATGLPFSCPAKLNQNPNYPQIPNSNSSISPHFSNQTRKSIFRTHSSSRISIPIPVINHHLFSSASSFSGVPANEISRSGLIENLVLIDLDPATAKLGIAFLGPFLSAFGFLFVVRIVMSWYPKLPVDKFPYVVAYAPTEPLLAQTRKVIPPLGGVDVTPVVWFGLLSFLNEILVGPQGLLVLLSQQV